MRRRVATLSVVLGLAVAGSAQANDATQVLYDLSDLRTQRVAQAPIAHAPEFGVPSNQLPISTPSLERRGLDAGWTQSGDDLEFQPRGHLGRRLGQGVQAPRGGNENSNQPTPNPEPGTMLLLGSALASAARFARRRSKA
jgi:hypothetical protein